MARFLEDKALAAVRPEARHEIRIAAHLLRILERDLAADRGDRTRSRDHDGSARWEMDDEAWRALVETTRQDLAVLRPGYTDWSAG